jgi:hypothetical protein
MVVALSLRCCAVLALLLSLPALAQTEGRAAEIQIKAAFLYKFGAFVEWPPKAFVEPDAPFIIGVLGADVLAGELEQLVSGRTVHGRRVAVRRLRRSDSLAGLHVLFVGRAETERLGEILEAASGQPVLTVTDSEEGLARGSMINFVTVDDKVRFDIALPQAERGHLKISSRLLAVARKVIPG